MTVRSESSMQISGNKSMNDMIDDDEDDKSDFSINTEEREEI